MDFLVTPSALQSGTVRVPGDKSISHRALLFGAIADGETLVEGFLDGEDCKATLAAVRQLGVRVDRESASCLRIYGVGRDGLSALGSPVDLGNSGTAMRLMTGLMCAQRFDSELSGDASLSGRPMGRVIRPLEAMGASIDSRDGLPPLRIHGRQDLRAMHYDMPIASAQVKSAILLAGLYADGETSVHEPAITRDHSERMLRTMGVEVVVRDQLISLQGGQRLQGCEVNVPGDLSSATFILLATLLGDGAEVVIENVGINPTRDGVLQILRLMGADIKTENQRSFGAEPVADLRVQSGGLEGIDVPAELVSLAIDEFPALFVAAAAASGVTRFSGLAELRVKESDRIAAMCDGLTKLGINVSETEDGAVVQGGRFGAADLSSYTDHRIAMALAVAGSVASGPVVVRDVDNVETSFPGFGETLRSLGIAIQ